MSLRRNRNSTHAPAVTTAVCQPCGPRRLETVLSVGLAHSVGRRQVAAVSGIMRTAPPGGECAICYEPLFGRAKLSDNVVVVAGNEEKDNWQYYVPENADDLPYPKNDANWVFRRLPEGDTRGETGWGKTYILNCSHEFHLACIAKAYSTESTCPMCRAQSSQLEIDDIRNSNQRQRQEKGLEPLSGDGSQGPTSGEHTLPRPSYSLFQGGDDWRRGQRAQPPWVRRSLPPQRLPSRSDSRDSYFEPMDVDEYWDGETPAADGGETPAADDPTAWIRLLPARNLMDSDWPGSRQNAVLIIPRPEG